MSWHFSVHFVSFKILIFVIRLQPTAHLQPFPKTSHAILKQNPVSISYVEVQGSKHTQKAF